MTERETGVKTYRVIVGPNGEVFQPASCWIVDVDMFSEKELRAAIEDPRSLATHSLSLGQIMAWFGARDLTADLVEPVEVTEDTR